MAVHRRKLGRPTDQRLALIRNLATSLLEHGRIETTLERAKETQRAAERMITLGKKNTLATRRRALAFITKEDVVTKLFEEIAPKYAQRQGGYTRVLKLGPRRGDSAEMAIIELVEGTDSKEPKEAKAPKTTKATKKVEETKEPEETTEVIEETETNEETN